MNPIRCPFCNAISPVGHVAAGQTIRCTSCSKTFMAPAGVSTPAVPTGPATSGATGVPTVPTTPAQGVNVSSPTVPIQPPSSAPQAQAIQPTPPASPHVVTGAGSGGVQIDARDRPASKTSGSLLAFCLVAAGICVVLGGLLLVVLFVKAGREEDEPSSKDANGQQIVSLTPSESRSARRSNVAEGIVIQLNDVAVDVDYVGYGDVRVKDENNRVVISQDKNYLQVYVNIKNLRPTALGYNSWYGNSFFSDGGHVGATLVDDSDRQYEMLAFTGVTEVQGHTREATLGMGEVAKDVLVFLIPSSIDLRTIGYFHLDLPADAYGGDGIYRFEIPRRVVQGF